MDHELRKAMYVQAAIQGILSSEPADYAWDSDYIASRAIEVAEVTLGIEDGTYVAPEPDIDDVEASMQVSPDDDI